MTLIYEKDGARLMTRVPYEDMHVRKKEEEASVTEYVREDTVPYVTPQISQRKIRRRAHSIRKKRRKAGSGAMGTLLILTAVLFCTFTLDFKFMKGEITKNTAKAAIKGLERIVLFADGAEQDSTEYPQMKTLYTLEYSEPVTQDGGVNLPVSLLERELSDKTEEQVKSVMNEKDEEVFSDGKHYFPITTLDLSASDVLALSNDTSFSPDTEYLLSRKPSSLENLKTEDGPLVLVIHTHGGESYTEYETLYPEDEETRSTDEEKTVVRVGKEIVKTLENFGISAVHDTVMHDAESFINAYTSSANSVKKYLEKHPSLRFVIDVHRDAVIKSNGESIRAATEIAGQQYAQLMMVVGTNEKGHNHPDWKENLSLALNLQKSMENRYPSLFRSINLRDVPFNQQLSDGYILLEAGTCANTLDEVLLSARAFGEGLAALISSNL